jgi:molybdenum cofactor biosynthesis protein MoaC
MVRVTSKADTSRRAIAVGHIVFSNPETVSAIRNALVKKGDVLGTARLAGIMAAKNCPALVPLCHPVLITGVTVDVGLVEPAAAAGDRGGGDGAENGGVEVEAEVQCAGKTGVEMEALTSVTAALLTVIDMVKAMDRGTRIADVRMVLKEGGKSGRWVDEVWEQKMG